MAPRTSRLKVVAGAGVGAGLLPTGTPHQIPPGERPYFVSILGDPVAAGSVNFMNQLITIPAGTAFTLAGTDFPDDCEDYYTLRQFTLNATLGPFCLIFGPVRGGALQAEIRDLLREIRDRLVR